MRAVVQRVAHAEVVVDGISIGKISQGIMVLVGFEDSDATKDLEYMLDKVTSLRIFKDEGDKMNLSVRDIGGSILIVPNFTLYGDCRHGRRPSYSDAARPENAVHMFDEFYRMVKESFGNVEKGAFGADMKVTLLNNGPVTLLLDSKKTF